MRTEKLLVLDGLLVHGNIYSTAVVDRETNKNHERDYITSIMGFTEQFINLNELR